MNFTVNHAVALGCVLAIGFYIGRHVKPASSTGAAAHNDTSDPGQWWSYAGSWA